MSKMKEAHIIYLSKFPRNLTQKKHLITVSTQYIIELLVEFIEFRFSTKR